MPKFAENLVRIEFGSLKLQLDPPHWATGRYNYLLNTILRKRYPRKFVTVYYYIFTDDTRATRRRVLTSSWTLMRKIRMTNDHNLKSSSLHRKCPIAEYILSMLDMYMIVYMIWGGYKNIIMAHFTSSYSLDTCNIFGAKSFKVVYI